MPIMISHSLMEFLDSSLIWTTLSVYVETSQMLFNKVFVYFQDQCIKSFTNNADMIQKISVGFFPLIKLRISSNPFLSSSHCFSDLYLFRSSIVLIKFVVFSHLLNTSTSLIPWRPQSAIESWTNNPINRHRNPIFEKWSHNFCSLFIV